METKDYRGSDVRLCTDGKYRWVYEMHMLKNPLIFWTVYKIFLYIVIIGFSVFGFFLYEIHGDWEGLWGMAKAAGLVLAIFLGLTILGVALIAIMYKGKYVVLFVMDDVLLVEGVPFCLGRDRLLGLVAHPASLGITGLLV